MTYTCQPTYSYTIDDYKVEPLKPWSLLPSDKWILKESFICQGCRDKMVRGEAIACMCYIPERDNRIIF
jgi:hypothetical protein